MFFYRNILRSAKNIFVSTSSVISNNLKLFKSSFDSNSKVKDRHETQDFISHSNFQNSSVLNENFHFQEIPHPLTSQANSDLLETCNRNYQSSSSCIVSPTKSTYVASSFAITNTTSVPTNTVMSIPCTFSTSHSTLDSQRPSDNFSPHLISPHFVLDQGLNKGECINGNPPPEISPSCCQFNTPESVRSTFVPPSPPAQFSLPPISVEKFDGNILDYTEFKIKMKSLLNMANFPDNLKVIYLKSYLSGEPLEIVAGIMPNDPGAYDEIWNIFDEDYGTPELVRDHHLSLLLSINSWSTCVTNNDLKKLYRHVSTHYRILQKFGSEAIEEAEAVKIFILPLLTGHAAYKITKLHQCGEKYNVPEILQILKSIISHQKFVESAKLLKSNVKLNQKPTVSSKENKSMLNQIPGDQNNFNSLKSTGNDTHIKTENLNILNLEKSSTLRFSCPICETDSHHHSQCKKYENRDEFWNHIMKNRLCANCLRPGHKWMQCFKEHSCKLGGCLRLDKHAPVLCRKYYS